MKRVHRGNEWPKCARCGVRHRQSSSSPADGVVRRAKPYHPAPFLKKYGG